MFRFFVFVFVLVGGILIGFRPKSLYATSDQQSPTMPATRLVALWDNSAEDNWLTTDLSAQLDISQTVGTYTVYRYDGLIFDPSTPPPTGTVTAYGWFNSARSDYLFSTDPNWSGSVGDTRDGYTLQRIEGHVYDPDLPPPAESVPIYSLYAPGRTDNFATTDPDWAGGIDQVKDGYIRYRLEGYAQPMPVPMAVGTISAEVTAATVPASLLYALAFVTTFTLYRRRK